MRQIHTTSVLRLQSSQMAQLIGYCTAYRSYLWQYSLPTPERNQAIRCIQALQGRLEKAQEQQQSEVVVSVSAEEKQALRRLFSELTRFYSRAPASMQRTQQLADLTVVRARIERMFTGCQKRQ